MALAQAHRAVLHSLRQAERENDSSLTVQGLLQVLDTPQPATSHSLPQHSPLYTAPLLAHLIASPPRMLSLRLPKTVLVWCSFCHKPGRNQVRGTTVQTKEVGYLQPQVNPAQPYWSHLGLGRTGIPLPMSVISNNSGSVEHPYVCT